MRATRQDGSYPRPMLCRDGWLSLDGEWDFGFDDQDEGLSARWYDDAASYPTGGDPFDRRITVPFPPESPRSGIGERGFHPVVWYRRWVAHELLVGSAAEKGREAKGGRDRQGRDARVLLHFGAVDFRAQVWLDGHRVCEHVGGQTPFTVDVTDVLHQEADQHRLVVRAEDDPSDVDQPRGKQDWRETPHRIWYERTTGIWQSVWAEVVPPDHVVDAAWATDVAAATLRGEITLSRAPKSPSLLEVSVSLGDEVLAEQWTAVRGHVVDIDLKLPALRNGQDRARLLWSPEHPVLIDIAVSLRDRVTSAVIDTVASYVGLRTVSVAGGRFQLNEQPYYVRSVLNQGYRPQTHLATAGSEELRREVETAKEIGFNAVRVHQKAEDPRYLWWADRLGLMVWGETASAYAFSPRSVAMLTTEWMDLVRRDRSHPSVVTWVPVNESWGVQDIASNKTQRSYSVALAELTRALDPTRPVLSNEGWEHVDSDIFGVHDYSTDPEDLRLRYGPREGTLALASSVYGPLGRRLTVGPAQQRAVADGDPPLMITEFGGVSMVEDGEAWGYAITRSNTAYATRLQQLFDALRASKDVVGFCYTQFMDTGSETNGLLFADGTPKLEIQTLHKIVTGGNNEHTGPFPSTFGWHD